MQIDFPDLAQYFNIFVFLGIAMAISILVILLPKLFAKNNPNKEKYTAYECGFDPFEDARKKFDIRFYLVAILFLIFDLEIAFLFPWAVTLKKLGSFGFYSMMLFLALLTIGFIYEWRKGALEWE